MSGFQHPIFQVDKKPKHWHYWKDGNQKSGKRTSWGKGRLPHYISTRFYTSLVVSRISEPSTVSYEEIPLKKMIIDLSIKFDPPKMGNAPC